MPRQTPALFTKILRYDAASPPFDERFNYCVIVGKLGFLENSTRPDMAYAMHQYTRFSQDLRDSHGGAIIHLVKYLKATREQGGYIGPRRQKELQSLWRRRTLFEMAAPYRRQRTNHRQVPDLLHHPVRRLSDHLVQQAADANHVIHNGGGLHRVVAIALQCDPHDATTKGNESKWLLNAFYLT